MMRTACQQLTRWQATSRTAHLTMAVNVSARQFRHPDFDRIFRAHQNTVEQFVFFVPLLGLAAMLWGDHIAALYGLIWSVGRFLYVVTYAQAAEKRSIGFFLSGVLSMIVLLALIVTWAMIIVGGH